MLNLVSVNMHDTLQATVILLHNDYELPCWIFRP